MDRVRTIKRLWKHARWADLALVSALRASRDAPADAVFELAHVIGTHELWLARLQKRPPRAEVWPEASVDAIETLLHETGERYQAYLATLNEDALDTEVEYTNSAGHDFSSSVGDILLHVALHGQYHRGKVNLMLRNAGLDPAPTDFIAWVRGAPAATRDR